MNNTNFFKRIVDECRNNSYNPMPSDTFRELVNKDEKKFMEILLKYRRIEHRFNIKIDDASYKSMYACIVKDIYRNDKLVSTECIDWSDIDYEWNDEDIASNELKVADMLEAALEGYSDEDFKSVAQEATSKSSMTIAESHAPLPGTPGRRLALFYDRSSMLMDYLLP